MSCRNFAKSLDSQIPLLSSENWEQKDGGGVEKAMLE